MGDVARDDQRAFQVQARLDRVFRQNLAHLVHSLVQIDVDGRLHARSGLGQETGRIFLELLEENAVLGDLGLHVAVGAAAHADAYGTRGRMARHTYHAHVVHEVFTAELGAHAALLTDFKHLFLPFQIAERTAALVARRGQMVEVSGRSLLDGGEVGLGRRTADHNGQMVRRTGRRAEVHDMGLDELGQRLLVQKRLGLLVQERLVGRAPSLGDEQEAVRITLSRVQVDLGRKVRAGVLFLGHRERNDLGIAQVAVAVCLVDTLREHLGVVAARIDVLALLADHDGRTGILTGRQLAFGGDRLIEQHRIGDELVVVGRFRIVQNARQFLQMRRAQVERHVGDRLARQQFQTLGGHLQNAAAVAFDRFHVILRKQAVFRRILRQRERFLINEFSHIISVLKIPHGQR